MGISPWFRGYYWARSGKTLNETISDSADFIAGFESYPLASIESPEPSYFQERYTGWGKSSSSVPVESYADACKRLKLVG